MATQGHGDVWVYGLMQLWSVLMSTAPAITEGLEDRAVQS